MSDDSIEYVTAPDGTRLAVHVLGSGPPVVCIPGGPARASAYLEDLGGLSETHTLLRMDSRGSGFSELPDERESLTYPRLADDIEVLREARGLETIDLIGHSAGCIVTLVYGSRHPDKVDRLVLVTPSGRGFGRADEDDIAEIRARRSGEPWYADAAAIEAELAFAPAHRRERPHRGLRAFSYGTWDERAQAHAASTDTQVSLRAMAAFGATRIDPQELVDALKNLTAPTLIVVGTMDGTTGVTAGYRIAESLPNATVVEIEGAGHFPWVDAPDRLREILTGFLDS